MILRRTLSFLFAFTLLLALRNSPAQPTPRLTPGSMDVQWNEGAPDCSKGSQPPLQVHPYNAQTFVLRENPCATAEAPFIYLLVGSTRALLIDTGDVSDAAKMPLASTVIGLLPRTNGQTIPLLILHTHGHLDHRSGDAQFESLPNVEIVPTDLAHVKKYFGFSDWPNGIAQIDLGNRTVDAIPTPGHYPSEVSYYDRNTGLFFSGDFFLPGRLLIEDAAGDLASAKRVADFVKDRPVTYVLGGHVELNADGGDRGIGFHYHPHEHVLQLTKQDLLGLPAVVASFNGFYSQSGMFVMYNQSRVLEALGAILLAVMIACVLLLRWSLRRRKKRLKIPPS
jgi:hydroxyacylglutathione hydrolase